MSSYSVLILLVLTFILLSQSFASAQENDFQNDFLVSLAGQNYSVVNISHEPIQTGQVISWKLLLTNNVQLFYVDYETPAIDMLFNETTNQNNWRKEITFLTNFTYENLTFNISTPSSTNISLIGDGNFKIPSNNKLLLTIPIIDKKQKVTLLGNFINSPIQRVLQQTTSHGTYNLSAQNAFLEKFSIGVDAFFFTLTNVQPKGNDYAILESPVPLSDTTRFYFWDSIQEKTIVVPYTLSSDRKTVKINWGVSYALSTFHEGKVLHIYGELERLNTDLFSLRTNKKQYGLNETVNLITSPDNVTGFFYFLDPEKNITLQKEKTYIPGLYGNYSVEASLYQGNYSETHYASFEVLKPIEEAYVLEQKIKNNYPNFEGEFDANLTIKKGQQIAKQIALAKKPLIVGRLGVQGLVEKSNVSQNLTQQLELANNYTFDTKLEIQNSHVKNINFKKLKIINNTIELGIEDLSLNGFEQSYAIDPEKIDFESATVTVIAKGTELYKCPSWNFATQNCEDDDWFLYKTNLVPGEEYTFEIGPNDPGFGEKIKSDSNAFLVQRGTASGSTIQLTDTLTTPVNTSQSFLVHYGVTASATPDDWQFTGNISSTTGLVFDSYNTVAADVYWEVVTSDNLFVQRGQESLATNTATTTVTLNDAIDTSRSFVIVNGRCNSNSNTDTRAGFFFGNLTNGTTLEIGRGNANLCDSVVDWQVIEWLGATVQSGSSTIADNTDSTTASISAVNLSNSFLFFGHADYGTDPGMDSNNVQGSFASATQLSFTQKPGTSYASSRKDVVWYVISAPELTVQSGTTTVDTVLTAPLTSVNMSRAFTSASWWSTGGGQTWGRGQSAAAITATNTVSIYKGQSGQTNDVHWFVSEYGAFDKTRPIISLNTADNIGLNAPGPFSFSYTPTDDTGFVNCSLIINNTIVNTTTSVTNATPQTLSYTFPTTGLYTWSINCSEAGISQLENSSQTRTFHVFEADSFFTNGQITNFSTVDVTSLNNLQIKNNDYGEINYSETLNLSGGSNLDLAVSFNQNIIFVNSTLDSRLDANATISFYNLSYTGTPLIVKDGTFCVVPNCVVESYSSSTGMLVANVTGFSNYTTEVSAQLNIWDETDTLEKYQDEDIIFFANYSKTLDGTAINQSEGVCFLSENSTGSWSLPNALVFNDTSGLYESTNSFTNFGTFSFNISCSGLTGYEDISLIDEFSVLQTPEINIDCSFSPTVQEPSGIMTVQCNATNWTSGVPVSGLTINHGTYDVNDWYKNGEKSNKGWIIGYSQIDNLSTLDYSPTAGKTIDSSKAALIRYGPFTYPFPHVNQTFNLLVKAGSKADLLEVTVCNDSFTNNLFENIPTWGDYGDTSTNCIIAGTINATNIGENPNTWVWANVSITDAYNTITENQTGLGYYSIFLHSDSEFNISPIGWEINESWMPPTWPYMKEAYTLLNNSLYTYGNAYHLPENNNPFNFSGIDMSSNVGLWYLEEPSGLFADSSINNNDATLVSGFRTTEGKVGNATNFTTPSNRLVVNDDPSLELNDSGTLEAWVNLRSYAPFAGIIHKGGQSNYDDREFSFGFSQSSGVLEFSLYNARGSSGQTIHSTSAVGLDEWHHVAATWDSDFMSVYIDGEQSLQYANSEGTVWDSDGPLIIGAKLNETYPGYDMFGLDGLIDEVAVYNISLSEIELKMRYVAGLKKFYADNRTINLTEMASTATVLSSSDTVDFIDNYPNFDEDSDYLEMTNNENYETARTSDYTACLFFKRNNTLTTKQNLMVWGEGLELFIENNDLVYQLRPSSGGVKQLTTFNDAVADTKWHHACVVRDLAQNQIRLVFDSSTVGVSAFSSVEELRSVDEIVFARDTEADGSAENFQGQIAQYFLVNYPQTTEQITEGLHSSWWALGYGDREFEDVYADVGSCSGSQCYYFDAPLKTPIAYVDIYDLNQNMTYNLSDGLYYSTYYTSKSKLATSQGAQGVNFTTKFNLTFNDRSYSTDAYWYVRGMSNSSCSINDFGWVNASKTGQYQTWYVNWSVDSSIPVNDKGLVIHTPDIGAGITDTYTNDGLVYFKTHGYGDAEFYCFSENDYDTQSQNSSTETFNIGCWSPYDDFDGTRPALELEDDLYICPGFHTAIPEENGYVIASDGTCGLQLLGPTTIDGGGVRYEAPVWGGFYEVYELSNRNFNAMHMLTVQNGEIGFIITGPMDNVSIANINFINMSIPLDFEHTTGKNVTVFSNVFDGFGYNGEDAIYITGPNVQIKGNTFLNPANDSDTQAYCDGCFNATLEQNNYWDIDSLEIYSLGSNRTIQTSNGNFTCEIGTIGPEYPYANYNNSLQGEYYENGANLYGELVDFYPCATKPDTPPEVYLISPTIGYYSENSSLIYFNVTATDNVDLADCTLYTDAYGSWSEVTTEIVNSTSDNASWGPIAATNGEHIWNAYCCDDERNCAFNSTNSSFTINNTAGLPVIELISPLSYRGDNDGNIIFSYNVTSNNTINNCSLVIDFLTNNTDLTITKNITQYLNVSGLGFGDHSWQVKCEDNYVPTNTGYSAINHVLVIPTTSYSLATNFSNLDLSQNVSLYLEKQTNNSINFTDGINLLSGIDLDSAVNLTTNTVSIDSQIYPELNKSATIYLTQLSNQYNPIIYYDGNICNSPQCTLKSYDPLSGTLVFNVTHFTNYTVGSNSKLELFDDTDSLVLTVGDNVTFYANYTNTTSGETIIGVDVKCNISDDSEHLWSTPQAMTYNESTKLFEFTKTIIDGPEFYFNVSCENNQGFENLQTIDNVTLLSQPLILSLSLDSTSGNFLDTDNLTCNYTANSFVQEVGINWIKNGQATTIVNYPIAGGDQDYFKDISGSHRDLSLFGTTFDYNYSLQHAAVFDGTSAYMNISGSESFTNDQFTVDVWVYHNTTSPKTYEFILGKQTTGNFDWAMYYDDATGHWKFSVNSLANFAESTSYTTQNWTHLAGVYDRVGGEIRIYVNGVLEGQTPYSSAMNSNVIPILVGNAWDASVGNLASYWFEGAIAHIKLYNYSLSSEQIKYIADYDDDSIMSQELTIDDTWQCQATPFSIDDDGLMESSATETIVYYDVTPPQVSQLTPANGTAYNLGDTINITANVTDNYLLLLVQAKLEWPGGSHTYVMTDPDGDGIFNLTIPILYTGRTNVTIIARDEKDNVNDAQKLWFDTSYTTSSAIYCTSSPCVADSSLIVSRANIGGTVEPNQPNTLDACTDGATGTYASDESLDNITVTSLNGTNFRAGDTVEVSMVVYCYDATSDNINYVYANDSSAISWRVETFEDPCPQTGYYTSTRQFVLDSKEGIHAFRGVFQYNGATTTTCGAGGYDDNDDLEFLVLKAREYVAPSVTLLDPSYLEVFYYGDSVPIKATILDDSDITTAYAKITKDALTWYVNLTDYDLDGNYTGYFSSTTLLDNYTIQIFVTDEFGNTNNTENTIFTINDSGTLLIEPQGCLPDPVTLGNTVVCKALATDEETPIGTVIANVTLPNTTVQYPTVYDEGTSTYNFSFSNTTAVGSYIVNWFVNNTNGISRTNLDSFFAREYVPPVTTLIYPQPGTQKNTSQLINFTINATDNVEVSSVYAYVTRADLSAIDAVELTNTVGDIWYGTYSIPGALGNFTVEIEANDTSGNSNNSLTTWFNVSFESSSAIFCGTSPCIADSSLIASRDTLATPEPNSPNTIDSCTDGTQGTYLTDETLENITVRTLNGTKFRGGDTIEVKITAYCYDGSGDNINFIYSNSSPNVNWKVKDFLDPCPAAGFNTISRTFLLDRNVGIHAFRGSVQYNGQTTSTCGAGTYDDNDDLEFFVDKPREKNPPLVTIQTPNESQYHLSSVIPVSLIITEETDVEVLYANVSWNSNVNQITFTRVGITNEYTSTFSNTSDRAFYNLSVFVNDTFNNINNTEYFVFEITDLVDPVLVIESPAADSGDNDGIVNFNYSVTDESPIDNCSLYINDSRAITNYTVSKGVSQTFTKSLAVGSYSWLIECFDNVSNAINSTPRIIHIINTTSFDGATSFNSENISQINDLSLTINGVGQINFTDTIDLTGGLDLGNVINISLGNLSVDTVTEPRLNVSAILTFENLDYDTTPIVLRNNDYCVSPDCVVMSYDSGIGKLIVNVTHFTSYTTTNNSQLQIWDESDALGGSNIKYVWDQVKFFANYTDVLTGESINGTNADCEIVFNESGSWSAPTNMTFNSSTLIYEYNRSFLTNETFNWNVSCDGLNYNYEPLNASDNIEIFRIPELVINSISFSNSTPIFENEVLNISINITNEGSDPAINFFTELNISFWNGTKTFNQSLTSLATNLSSQESKIINFTWTADIGTYIFDAYVDSTKIVNEYSELNNALTTNRTVSAWHIFYGDYLYEILLSNAVNETLKNWSSNSPEATFFYADIDSNFYPFDLQALSGAGDLAEADVALGLTGYLDSVSELFDADHNGVADNTIDLEIAGSTVSGIPVINTTNTSSFLTGILWDSSDGASYTGAEDLVFITFLNASQVGYYGTYDFEVRIPSTLETLFGVTNSVEKTVEVK